jgi:hypothetical protein
LETARPLPYPGKPDALQVARQRKQNRPRGAGVDAGDHHGVGTSAGSVRPGVAAQQEHIDPGVLDRDDRPACPSATVENRTQQRALGGGQAGRPAQRDHHQQEDQH